MAHICLHIHMYMYITFYFFKDVPQLELEMHLEGLHLVEVEKLDWTRPLSSQVYVVHTHNTTHHQYLLN